MDINQKLTEELGVKRWQVDAAVKLIDEEMCIRDRSISVKPVGAAEDKRLPLFPIIPRQPVCQGIGIVID